MGTVRTKEFDAFGPWIFEICREHDLPPLFSGYSHLKKQALMMFKIPRHIERRKANPFMHLYDAVIAIFNDHVLMLYRIENSVSEQRVSFKELQAIEVTHCLLNGDLKLYTNTKIYTINYNTVSQNVITKAVNLLRTQQNHAQYKSLLEPMQYDINTIEYLYVNLINDFKKNDKDAELVAYQPNINLPKPKGINGLFRRKPDVQCSAFVSNKKEIVIIGRTSAFKKKDEVSYSYTYTYLSISQIKSAAISTYDSDSGISVLTLKTDRHSFSILFDKTQQNIIQLYNELR